MMTRMDKILIILLLVNEGRQTNQVDFMGEESRKRLKAAENKDQKIRENTLANLQTGTIPADDIKWATDQSIARLMRELVLLPIIRYNSEDKTIKEMCEGIEGEIKERIPTIEELTSMDTDELYFMYSQLERDLAEEILKVTVIMVTKHQAALEAVEGEPFKKFFEDDDLQRGNLSTVFYNRVAYDMAQLSDQKHVHPLLIKLDTESPGEGQEVQEKGDEDSQGKEEGILERIKKTIVKVLKGENTKMIKDIMDNKNGTTSKRLDIIENGVKYLLNCNTCQIGWKEFIQIGISIIGLICQIVTVCWVVSARKQDKKTQKQIQAQIKALEDDMGTFQTRTNRRVDDLRAHLSRKNNEEVPRRVVAKRRGII